MNYNIPLTKLFSNTDKNKYNFKQCFFSKKEKHDITKNNIIQVV